MSRFSAVALSLAIVLVLVAGVAAATGMWHPRDEYGFHVYVTADYDRVTSSDVDPHLADYAWAAQHPEETLAEGDRACDWLGDQSDPASTNRRYEAHALAVRYVTSADMGRRTPFSHLGQQTVVIGAWEHLCKDTRNDKTIPFTGGD